MNFKGVGKIPEATNYNKISKSEFDYVSRGEPDLVEEVKSLLNKHKFLGKLDILKSIEHKFKNKKDAEEFIDTYFVECKIVNGEIKLGRNCESNHKWKEGRYFVCVFDLSDELYEEFYGRS